MTVRFDYGRANVTELKLAAPRAEAATAAVEFAFKNVLETRLSFDALGVSGERAGPVSILAMAGRTADGRGAAAGVDRNAGGRASRVVGIGRM